jgi:hypothetical protein
MASKIDMNLLFVAPPIPDFLADSLLHGLRSMFGNLIVDVPKAEQMYVNAPPRSFHGRGMTLYKTLHDDNIDRTNIAAKVKSKFFDAVIYGCVNSCYPENELLHHWNLVKANYPVNKILLIDGADPITVKEHLLGQGIYFKREIPDNSPLRNVLVPISFSIPAEKIFTGASDKSYVVAPLIPGVGATYIYNDEASYYQMYRQSMFALTWKKAGWDCLRHYEILAQGALPLFLDIEHLPKRTMMPWPRIDIRAILDMSGLKLGDFNPSMTFKYDDRNTLTNVDLSPFTFDMAHRAEYIEMSQKMRMYLIDNLTTAHVAKELCTQIG